MKAIGRSVLAVVVGVIVTMGLIMGVETVCNYLYPPPPGLDASDHEAMGTYIADLPVGAFLVLLIGWAIASGVGAWVAARLAGRSPITHGLIVGAWFLAGAIMTMVMIPHPVWMVIGAIAALSGFSYLGARVAATAMTPARAAS
jgi:hypothetical protein